MAPEVSRAPDDAKNATEAPSRATTGVLNDGTLNDGTLNDGTLNDGTLDDGTLDDSTMDDSTMDDSVLQELVGQIPPAGGALCLVRTYAPDERSQLDALRILSESAPSVPIASEGQDEPHE